MDSASTAGLAGRKKRQMRSAAEKLRIVEETLAPGASVALVAREHGVNANQVFKWRRLHLAGKLIKQRSKRSTAIAARLLPVTISDAGQQLGTVVAEAAPSPSSARCTAGSGSIDIQFSKAHVRIEGSADPAVLRDVAGVSAAMIALPAEAPHLDRGGRDRHAAWLHRVECASADGAGAGAALRSRLYLSWSSRGSDQAVVVRRRRALFVRQAAGTRTIHLAQGGERHGFVDARAVVDAAGRHRLGTTGANDGDSLLAI